MAINKVVYGNKTLVDLTGDDITAEDVEEGKTVHLPSGATATGTANNWKMGLGTAIPASSDLDDYKTVGNYYTLYGKTITNKPFNIAYWGLKVFNTTSSSNLIQMAYPYSIGGTSENFAYRTLSADGSTWSSWVYPFDSKSTIPTTNGGTGSSYTDFAALADAIGSGGNWVDVSTAFTNGLASSDSNFDSFGGSMFIYEKLFAFVYVQFNIKIALSENYLTDHKVGTIPDFAKPKSSIPFPIGAGFQGLISISSNRKIGFTNFRANSANTVAAATYVYPLATPYSS